MTRKDKVINADVVRDGNVIDIRKAGIVYVAEDAMPQVRQANAEYAFFPYELVDLEVYDVANQVFLFEARRNEDFIRRYRA